MHECEDVGSEPSCWHRTQLHIFCCSGHLMFAGYSADPIEAVTFYQKEFRIPSHLFYNQKVYAKMFNVIAK